MSKNSTILIGAAVVVIVAAGAYAIFHKSNKTTASNSSPTSSAPAVNNAVITTKSSSSVGQYLVASNGMALYTYGGDSSGVSNVTGALLGSWPAYVDSGSTTGLPSGVSTIKRTDNGQTQFTYNGMPLYFFTADSAGQVSGDGISNFNVAKPTTASSAAQPATTPSSTPAAPASSSSSGYPY